MTRLNFLTTITILFIAIACSKGPSLSLNFEKLSGYVQKGPYLNGSNITITELSRTLAPTGKTFSTQIFDNKGQFEIKNLNITSEFVELKADGFYFNEATNEGSSAQLTLFALTDLSMTQNLNVNLLSHLEKNRIDYLVSNGTDFDAAKNKAQREILAIFNITKEDMNDSEKLDISKAGDDNAILLAISIIVQGHLSVADLSELLANISSDIREDGVLNSTTLGATLINNAKNIAMDNIRQNLEFKYSELGVSASIPDFEKYVNQFIDNTEFEYTDDIQN